MAVALLDPASIWGQLASFFFLMAALFSHVLPIRFFLTLAYIMLIILYATGIPSWPEVARDGFISLDGLIWALVTVVFHAYALYRHLKDELPVPSFASEEEEELWRFFYRRSGMARLEFKTVLKHSKWRRVTKGSVIARRREYKQNGFLLVSGVVKLNVDTPSEVTFLSGSIFDKYMFNVFGIRLGYSAHENIKCIAMTDCVLVVWDIADLEHLATKAPLPISIAFRNFLLYSISDEYNRQVVEPGIYRSADGRCEKKQYLAGAKSRDFAPLEDGEIESEPWHKRFTKFICGTLNPFPPEGIAHLHPLPETGVRMRNRLTILKEQPFLGKSALLNKPEDYSEEGEETACTHPEHAKSADVSINIQTNDPTEDAKGSTLAKA